MSVTSVPVRGITPPQLQFSPYYVTDRKDTEKALLIIKPGFINLALSTVLQALDNEGLMYTYRLVRPRSPVWRDFMKKLYQEHSGKEFFEPLIDYMVSDSFIVFAIAGLRAQAIARDLVVDMRACDPTESADGEQLRPRRENVAHASDSIEAGAREVALFRDIFDLTLNLELFVYRIDMYDDVGKMERCQLVHRALADPRGDDAFYQIVRPTMNELIGLVLPNTLAEARDIPFPDLAALAITCG